jgi:hypothetical protein
MLLFVIDVADLWDLHYCHAINPALFYFQRNPMNKAQFAKLVQKHGDYSSKAAADTANDAVTSAITEALSQKEDVTLLGFGSFKTAT